MHKIIFIYFIIYTQVLATEASVKGFDGNEDVNLTIELKDSSIIKNACFFTQKTLPNNINKPSYTEDWIFIPREDMICAIRKDNLKKITLIGSKGVSYVVFKNNETILVDLIEKTSFYRIYNSKNFGKIKIKNRNMLTSESIPVSKNNQTVMLLSRYLNIPKELNSIKGLIPFYLKIRSLNFSKNINIDIADLANFIYLERLNLSNTKALDISHLNKMSVLQELDLSNSKVADISSLKNLRCLEELDLSNSKVADISSLKNLRALKKLNLSNTKTSDLTAIKKLKHLKNLNLAGTKVTDVNSLKELSKLKAINLSNTKIANSSSLKSLLNIRYLQLNNTSLKDFSFLENLTSLKYLSIKNCNIKDFSFLKKIDNISVEIEDEKINELSKKYPAITFSSKSYMNPFMDRIDNNEKYK